MSTKETKAFLQLIELMKELRIKCPWDREQTFLSLKPHTLEEVHELAEALYQQDTEGIQEELGDVLMHFIFYVLIAEEKKLFTLTEVIEGVMQKLIFRHPHVFDTTQAIHNPIRSAEEVTHQWQERKKKEGRMSALEGVPKGLSGLVKALRIQQKASENHFDFVRIQDVWRKCEEEVQELQKAVAEETNIEEELGDVLFAYTNYARFLGLNPELALQRANQKFIQRFHAMERLLHKEGKGFEDLHPTDKEALWQQAKKKE